MFPANELFSQSRNRTTYSLYNIGLGSLLGGVGAVINKDPDQKFGKVLIKGLAQGALGGYIIYQGKNLNRLVYKKKELGYSWPAKFINAAGVSIVENAALNRNFWEQCNLHIGFNRIEFHTKDRFRVKYKIRLAALAYTAFTAWGRKLETAYSLKTGNFVFSGKDYPWNQNTFNYGAAFGSAIVIRDAGLNLAEEKFYSFMAHELIHVMQYEDFNGINAWVRKPIDNVRYGFEDLETLNSLIYLDMQMPVFGALYLLEGHNAENRSAYYQNFFEAEARFFSMD